MDLAYEEIKEYHALHAYVEEHYQEGKTNYLFVDEVQMLSLIHISTGITQNVKVRPDRALCKAV